MELHGEIMESMGKPLLFHEFHEPWQYRRTDSFLIARPRLHSMQRGQNSLNMTYMQSLHLIRLIYY